MQKKILEATILISLIFGSTDFYFYNPNIQMANQLNQPNEPYTLGGTDATFLPMNASSNMNSSANAYAGIFGNPGPDPISTAIGAPGYGLTFADYATGGTYG